MLWSGVSLALVCLCAGCEKAPAQNVERSPFFTAELLKPRGVAVGPTGRVFVVDMAGYMTRFSATGHFEHRWEMPKHDTGTPSGLFVDERERVFVPDTHNSRVIVYDADGKELARFGQMGTGAGEFLYPNDVVVDRDGFIYVSEYGGNDRISKYSPEFGFVLSFGGQENGPRALAVPYGLTLDGAGTLWVADTGNHRLCRFDREGRLLKTIGGVGRGPGELRYPYDVTWTGSEGMSGSAAEGYLVVCEKANHRVQVFTTHGRSCALWGGAGRAAGRLDSPTGITTAGGRVLVADTGNNRLVVVSLSTLLSGASPALAAGGS